MTPTDAQVSAAGDAFERWGFNLPYAVIAAALTAAAGVGLNWEISEQTKKEIAEIEKNSRDAMANAHNIRCGTAAAGVGTEAEENHRMGFVSATASDGSKWDRWYSSLPSDLRRKLSLHDFKRLGDLFDAAAAGVGETNANTENYSYKAYEKAIEVATIERCAQWLELNWNNAQAARAMRRALKSESKPQGS